MHRHPRHSSLSSAGNGLFGVANGRRAQLLLLALCAKGGVSQLPTALDSQITYAYEWSPNKIRTPTAPSEPDNTGHPLVFAYAVGCKITAYLQILGSVHAIFLEAPAISTAAATLNAVRVISHPFPSTAHARHAVSELHMVSRCWEAPGTAKPINFCENACLLL